MRLTAGSGVLEDTKVEVVDLDNGSKKLDSSFFFIAPGLSIPAFDEAMRESFDKGVEVGKKMAQLKEGYRGPEDGSDILRRAGLEGLSASLD